MTKAEIIEYLYDNNVRADITIEQMAEDLADRKTESDSEIPNNCEVKNYCDDCLYTDTCDSKEFFYACTSKATISKMEQVDKDINVRSKEPQTPMCETCRYDKPNNPKCDECIVGEDKPSNYAPQTDCPWK